LGLAAIGTDTAGSVREPAAQCGIVGLKPTYGRVSARGVVPLSVSLDHVGPLTRTVEDAARLLQVIAGYDSGDPASVDMAVANFTHLGSAEKSRLRIAIPRKFFCEDLDPEVSAAFEEAISVLRTIAADVTDIDLVVPTDRTLQLAESYAYHADHVARTPELFQPETLRRIRAGEGISSEVAEDKRRELKTLREEVQTIFENTDLLVTPTVPIPALQIAELKEHPDLLRPRELVLLRNTRPFNVWGLPAISVPCGFTRSGLPIGLQIAGPHWSEARVLQLAHAYEQATAWHTLEPKPSAISQ
jgi:Asp-tRNA(Asn)/Glu-tRNA(Gln) amidotransferase A subunit family amidase